MNRHTGIVGKTAVAGVGLVAAAAGAPATAAKHEEPFKQTNIHFETNASACDMGIQMSFDTEGITIGEIENPYGQDVFSLRAVFGMETTGDLTELFQERVEPPITELVNALDCEPEPGAEAISLSELLADWPAGWYEFDGTSRGQEFEGRAKLSHRVPAGPEIIAPEDGAVVSDDSNLLIRWEAVTEPILPFLGPVEIVGYHVVVAEVVEEPMPPGATKTEFDVDLSATETTLLLPKQFLEPNRMYEFEVLATEKGGNQTIAEGGVFCTQPIKPDQCAAP